MTLYIVKIFRAILASIFYYDTINLRFNKRLINNVNKDNIMFNFSDFFNKEDVTNDDISALEIVNYQIAELKRIKEDLEAKIISELDHQVIGQRTYTCGKYAVTIKTGLNYGIDKEEYQATVNHLPACFNPVKIEQTYKIDKKILEDVEKFGNEDEKKMVASFITEKPAKPNVSIKAAS